MCAILTIVEVYVTFSLLLSSFQDSPLWPGERARNILETAYYGLSFYIINKGSGLVELPKQIKIGGIEYRIILLPLKSEELNYGENIGMISHTECKIYINKDMPIQKQQETLIHEIIHGIDVFIGDNNHESFEENVEMFGRVLFQVLKDNDLKIKYESPASSNGELDGSGIGNQAID